MNNTISDLFPSLIGGRLNDLATNRIPDTKTDEPCEAPEKRFFSGRSTSSCKPLEDLIIEDNNSYGHQQLKPKKQKQKLTINGKKINIKKSLVDAIISSAQNPSTHSRKSGSVTQPPLSQTETEKLLKRRKRDAERKAKYRATEEGKLVQRKAAAKYRSSEAGMIKTAEYQAEYKKTPKGIISSAISNAKSNAAVSALNKGFSMTEAKALGEKAAENKKAELLAVFDIPWLQTGTR